MKKYKKYIKPKIKAKTIKHSFFLSDYRIFDSFDDLLVPNVFAASSGCSSCCCFVKGTKILMTDSTTKEIQDIKPGDSVFSYDLDKKTLRKDTVTDTKAHLETKDGYLLINNTLKVTCNHIMYVNNEWKKAHHIKKNDILLSSKGEQIVVHSLKTVSGTYDVYNLHLKNENHNFFADGLLAHNMAATIK